MQRLNTESRIEHSQEADLPVHGAVFWISTEKRRRQLQSTAEIGHEIPVAKPTWVTDPASASSKRCWGTNPG